MLLKINHKVMKYHVLLIKYEKYGRKEWNIHDDDNDNDEEEAYEEEEEVGKKSI